MIKKNASGNIVLIGMPGTGKTTVGKFLGNMLGFEFVDTDQLVTDKTGKTPRQLVEEGGRELFLKVQDQVVLEIKNKDTVIATGGGLVHSDTAMKYLKAIGSIVYLNTSYQVIEDRMDKSRKLVRTGGTLLELYNQRTPLYRKYADKVIDCDNRPPEDICKQIVEFLEFS